MWKVLMYLKSMKTGCRCLFGWNLDEHFTSDQDVRTEVFFTCRHHCSKVKAKTLFLTVFELMLYDG